MDDLMQSVYGDMPHPQDFKKQQSEQQKKALEVQRLCYEIFLMNPEGRKLYEHLQENFLINARISAITPGVELHAMYLEGMREVVRGLMVQAKEHQQRIVTQTGG